MITKKIIEIELGAKKYRGERGRDKKPRKTNVNSLLNLKPYWEIKDANELGQSAREPIQKTSNSKIWGVLLVLFGLAISIFVAWFIYKNRTSDSSELDNKNSDVLAGDVTNDKTL